MKKFQITLFVVVFCMIGGNTIYAQGNDTLSMRTAMKALSWMEGHWKGVAYYQRAQQRIPVYQEEFIKYKLRGLVLIIEGVGKDSDAPEAKIVFNALAILSSDPANDAYKMSSYLLDGRSAEAYFKKIADHQYQWGIANRMRYTITYDPAASTWNETGEYSGDDGNSWYHFFDMNLSKVKD